MSKQVDERVVSMQFDNRHFEQNVSQTMSTLDKLKQKLRLDGASTGVEAVTAKFSALEVMGVTALANITNSAVNAGKRMVAALTIDPIKTGFNEYEMKMDSVKTIMASTGESVETVNKYLNELNDYSDQTIYSFADMTQNIGKFTNAGVKLEDAVLAIQGISNEAAVSGANANEASRAMYNFAQALSSGFVKLIDWKSIENANMATVEFKEQLIQSAVAAGTLKKSADGMYTTLKGNTLNATKNFNDTLQDQWMTSEVLINTLKNYADETTAIGEKAFAAAKKVTKLSQVFDIAKETAQSGWAQTWEIIFGDINKAEAFFTPISEALNGIIDGISDFRNKLLKNTLSFDPWKNLIGSIVDKYEKSGFGKTVEAAKKVADGVEKAAKSLEYYQTVVNKVWRGDYNNRGDNPDRRDLLAKDGYNPKVIQNLVNLGYKHKITEEDVAAAHKKAGVAMSESTEATKENAKAAEQNAEASKQAAGSTDLFSQMVRDLSDEELKNLGFTQEEVKMLREWAVEAERLGIPMTELMDRMSEMDGRTALIESLKNAGSGLIGIFKALKEAWIEIFPPISALRLYSIIYAIHDFSKSLRLTEAEGGKLNETGRNLKRTFKGVFALVDIIATLIGGPLKIALKIIGQLLGVFDLDILSVTANLGDALVGFRDWMDSVLDFTKVFEGLAPMIKGAISAIKNWIEELKKSDNLARDIPIGIAKGLVGGLSFIGKALYNLGNYIWTNLTGFFVDHSGKQIGSDIVRGLALGLWEGVKIVGQFVMNVVNTVLETFQTGLDTHSPSKKTQQIGKWTIEGFIVGVKETASLAWKALKDFALKAIAVVKQIDWGGLFTAAVSAGLVLGVNKIGDGFSGLGEFAAGLGEMLQDVGVGVKKVLKGFASMEKAAAFNMRAEGIKALAIAIGILAASLLLISFIKPNQLWRSLAAIVVLSGIIGALLFLSGKMDLKQAAKIGKMTLFIAGMAVAMLMLAGVVKTLSKIGWDGLAKGAVGVLLLSAIIVGLVYSTKNANRWMPKLGGFLLAFSIAIHLLIDAVKRINKLEPAALLKGIVVLAIFKSFITSLIKSTGLAGKQMTGLAATLIAVGIAMNMFVWVIKAVDDLEPAALVKGIIVLAVFKSLIKGLIKSTRLVGNRSFGKVGGTILAVGAAMLLMTMAVKIIGDIDILSLIKGIIVISVFGSIIKGMIEATLWAGNDAQKLGLTILAMAVAIGIMGTVAILLSFIKLKNLAKGVIAIALLGAILSTMIRSTKDSKDCMNTLTRLIVAIGLLAVALIALSFIETEKLASSTLALAGVMFMLAVVIKAMAKLGKDGAKLKKCWPIILAFAGIIAVLGGVLVAMSLLGNPKSLIQSAVALGAVLLALSTSLEIVSKSKAMKGNKIGKIILALAGLSAVMALVGGILIGMSMLGVQNAIGNAVALSLVMVVLAEVALVISKLGANLKSISAAALGMAELAIVMGLVGLVLVMMSALGAQNAIANALALSLLMVVLTSVAQNMTHIGKYSSVVLAAVPAMFALVGVMAAVATIITIMDQFDTQSVLPNAIGLSVLLLALSGACLILGWVGPTAMLGIKAVAALAALILAFGVVVGLVGWLMTSVPEIETFVDSGVDLMIKLADGLGRMIGAFVTAIAEAVLSLLPTVGAALSDFWTNAQGFIQGVQSLNGSFAENVAVLVAGILVLTAASFLEGIISLISLGSVGIDAMGTLLSDFWYNAKPFVDGIQTLNPKTLEGGQILADTILTLTKAGVMDGIARFFGSKNALQQFAEQLPGLGTAITNFANNTSGLTDADVTAAGNCADIVTKLAGAAQKIPNTGGLLGMLVGDNDMGPWADQLFKLACGIVDFVNVISVAELSKDTVDIASYAADIIIKLAEAAQKIPNTGGWLGTLIGDNDMGPWADQLTNLGTGIKSFITTMREGKITNADITVAENAAGIISELATVAKEIPNSGGWLATIVGNNDLGTFADQFPKAGEGIANFAEKVKGITGAKLNAVKAAVDSIKAITGLKGIKTEDFTSFGSGIKTLGPNMLEYVNAINKIGMTDIQSVTAKVKEVINVANDVAKVNIQGVDEFAATLKKLGTEGVAGFVGAFTSADLSTKLENACATMMQKMANGLEKKKDAFVKAAEKVADAGYNHIAGVGDKSYDYAGEFYTLGQDFGAGLVKGIKSKADAVYQAAYALGQKAVQGEKDGQKSNSPSKLTIKAGKWLGEGLVIGMEKMSRQVYKSGYGLGNTATETISSAISKVSDFINSDIDAQPTIRPVLDLSDVEAGVGAINGMLPDRTLSVNTSAVGTVAAAMAARQNGATSDDVVSAIKLLRKDIAGMPRDSVNINGITYSGDSDINNAVQALVRAARVERRV